MALAVVVVVSRGGVDLTVDGRVVAPVELAGSYLRRLRGMLLRRRLPPALLLYPGAGVHGIGMSRSLDVAQLAPLTAGRCRSIEQPHVVRHVALLRPFGFVGSRRGVCSVLEAPTGSFDDWGLGVDSVLGLRPARSDPNHGDQHVPAPPTHEQETPHE